MPEKKPGRLATVLLALPRIAGSGANAAYTLATGDPVGGAMAGEALATGGEEILQRALSARQEDRVATVIERAQLEVDRRLASGLVLRPDGLFNGPTPEAEEIIEGVLLAARDEHQAKKLPYIANILANFAFRSDVAPDTANLALRDAETLTWLDLRLMGMVMRAHQFPLVYREIRPDESDWAGWAELETYEQLIERGYIKGLSYEPTTDYRPGYDTRMIAPHLTRRGELVSGMMELRSIPHDEIAGPYALLRVAGERTLVEKERERRAQERLPENQHYSHSPRRG